MASPGLESSLCRGLVLRLVLDSSVLDDPELTTREKFVVILNHLCPDDPIYFVMAPSKLDRFKSVIHLANEIVTLDPARYVFLNRPTALDFTSVKRMALGDMGTLYAKGLTHVAGQLEVDDLARCDEGIRRSRFIEPRILPLILPGDFV